MSSANLKTINEEEGSSANCSLSKGNNGEMDSTTAASRNKSLEMDNDSKCMKTSRIAILVTLLLTAAIAGGLTYYFTSHSETDQFEVDVSLYRCQSLSVPLPVIVCVSHL
jgi:hypothetical protein